MEQHPAAREVVEEDSDLLGRDVRRMVAGPATVATGRCQLAVLSAGCRTSQHHDKGPSAVVVAVTESRICAMEAGGAVLRRMLTVVQAELNCGRPHAGSRGHGGRGRPLRPPCHGHRGVASRGWSWFVATRTGRRRVVSRDADAVRGAGGGVTRLRYARCASPARLSPLMHRRQRSSTGCSPPRLVAPSVPVSPMGVSGPGFRRLAALLRRQMLAPVRWERTSQALGELGVDAVVECGAVPTLGPLVRQVHPGLPTYLLTGADALPPALEISAFASTTA